MLRALLASLCLALAVPLSAVNLLQNPGFTADLSHWTIPSHATGVWSSFDRGGGASGSALITSAGNPGDAPNAAILQCVAVSAGHAYAVGASIFVPADVAPGAVISPTLDLRFFSSADCSGADPLLQRVAIKDPIFRDTWVEVQSYAVAPPGSVSALAGFTGVDFDGNAATETIHVYIDDGYLLSDATCTDTPSHLCLGDRFLVYGDWDVPSQSRAGYMRALSVTVDSGLFWFFAPDNLEVFVKVLDACFNPFNHYWVFASGLTNVGVRLHVDDTVSGQTRLYENTAGTAFAPIQDTSAFATCP